MSQKINWVFTINNPTQEELNNIDGLVAENKAKYVVYQIERGQQGTLHAQGYVQLVNKKRLRQVKEIVGRRAHVEDAKGNPVQNRVYCTKEQGRERGPFEFGSMSGQGKRKDLEEFIAAA